MLVIIMGYVFFAVRAESLNIIKTSFETRKDTQIKFYQVMAVPTLLYGSECWTMRKRDMHKLQAAEMRSLRSVKGCTRLDKIRNEDIRKK
jgi:hypothetical protein